MAHFAAERPRARRRGRTAVASAVAACVLVVGAAAAAVSGSFNPFGSARVGQTSSAGGVLLPSNQWITPFGTRMLDTNHRLVASTISPDGHYLAALGWNEFSGYLTVFDLHTGSIVTQTALQTGSGSSTDYSVGPDGPLFSPDGSTLWVPQSTYLLRFSFNPSTGAATQTASIGLCGNPDLTSSACNPNAGPSDAAGADLPAGMALAPDGSKLYVALNGANALGVIDTSTNKLVQQIPVGNAPRQVVLADGGTVAYVSDEGGRPAHSGDATNLSDGTPIVADPSTGAATTGNVSVVDLNAGKETQEIPVGLEPTALYQTGSTLFVANSNDDSISMIDEGTNQVTHTVTTNPVPGAHVGSYANAITMTPDNQLLVSIGRDNAIADYAYQGPSQAPVFKGLIPTDWYPVGVAVDPALGNEVVVTNDKGIGARGPESTIGKGPYTTKATGHNTYDDTGSVTAFAMPGDDQLHSLTERVFTDNAWTQIQHVNDGSYDTVPNVIPRHLGGGSVIKHVVVIVRENRTYDQELGDLAGGNGDPSLAQFGQQVTPNAHALASRFGALDNFYDEGTLSADGHNWLVQANANDYVEKEFGAFYRSYPSQGGDALAYQRDGFLWNAAEKAGLTVGNFGEYIYNPYNLSPSAPKWDQWYQESQYLEGKQAGPEPISNPCQYVRAQSDIASLQAITDPCFPNFQLQIPDQYRVDEWMPQFHQMEQSGKMPALQFMWLMADHTGGAGNPDAVAQVADNDLAVGRVIDAVSHSKFWKSTAIFIVEDDTQNGVDHVDGHRGPAFVVSPWSRGGVVDGYYTQLNMVKTIEQILGIPAMNQEDLAAEPMYDAFQSQPNTAPYDVQANQIPLTLGAPGYPSTFTPAAAARAGGKARGVLRPQGLVPRSMRSVYRAWLRWDQAESDLRADSMNPAQMNRFDWYSAHNWRVAYPGDPKIYLPDQVPGRHLPADYVGEG